MIARNAEPGATVMDVDLPTWRVSTQRYLQMIEAGVFGPGDRVELIGGKIAAMSPAGPGHNHTLHRLVRLLAPLLDRFELSIQGTLQLAEGHVYDPDVMLLHRRDGGYKDRLPGPGDVALLIEAADASLRRDRHIKGPMYAAAGIADYWIADLEREAIVVHREPVGEAYNQVMTYTAADASVTPLAAADFPLRVGDIFA